MAKKVCHTINRTAETKQFPPPFKLTPKLMDKLVERYEVHRNPDLPPCENCGLRYRDMRTGMDFGSVQDMLFVHNDDSSTWRQKGRHSVLGLWFEIKRSMWQDHLEMCEDPEAQEEWLKDFDPGDFEPGSLEY